MDSRFMFRGKRTDNGEWVQGFLAHEESCNTDIPYIGFASIKPNDWIEADPATVGQCTGLTAAISYRGEKPEERWIFEGDALGCDGDYYGFVHYDIARGRYCLVDEDGEITGTCADDPENWEIYEIIGNRWDNPELTEVAQ